MQNRILPIGTAILIAGFVAGCVAAESTPTASNDAPPPTADAAAAAPSAPVGGEAQHVVVQAGQSVSRVAAHYHVSKQALIEANHLEPPYKIKAGQNLLIPGSPTVSAAAVDGDRHIVVEEGRSVSRIAKKYGVSERAIIEANHLEAPFKIKTGQKLLIPGAAETAPTTVAAAEPLPAPAQAPVSAATPSPPPPSDSAAHTEVSPASMAASASPPAPVAAEKGPAAPTSGLDKAVATAAGARPPVSAEPLPAPSAPTQPTTEKSPALGAPATPTTTPTPSPAAEPAAASAAVPSPAAGMTPAAAPSGVTCPPGTVGMSSVDVTKTPVFICHRVGT